MLNRCYRIVWHAASQTWQVVSELARGKAKSQITKVIAGFLFTGISYFAWAEDFILAKSENNNPYSEIAWHKEALDLENSVNRMSSIVMLSRDGKIAVGEASEFIDENKVIVWSGENWQTKTYLSSLNEVGYDAVNFLSKDGNIIVWSSGYDATSISTGKNWQKKTSLGSLGTLDRWNIWASEDGKIIGGQNNQHQAIILSGENWQTVTVLGTLKDDNSGRSKIYTLSTDGKIAGGQADYTANDDHMRAIIWSGENWQTKTALGTLRPDNRGGSRVRFLSADGKIAGGDTYINASELGINNEADIQTRAIIWSGENWQTKTDLGTLKSDNSGSSEIHAFSEDGKVVGGWADYDGEYKDNHRQAIIWSGENWQTKTSLGGLRADNIVSFIAALSADGKIAGGMALNDKDEERAIIWSGDNWQTKTDLGTLKTDNSGQSTVFALSADGKVVAGKSENEYGYSSATLWHLKFNEPEPAPQPEPVPQPDPAPQPELKPEVEIVGKINRDFTVNALQQLGADSISLMSMQQHALNRLQQGCYTDQTFCYAVRSDWVKGRDHRDTAVGFSLGYHFGNGFLLGLNADRSLQRSLPESYKRNRNNLGWGVFARWQGENWYIAPAVAWDYYDAQVKRPLLPNTETEQHTSRIKGFGTSLTLGQDFTLSNNMKLGWYSALRYQRISRSGYSEQRVAFPVSFGDMRLKETTIALGATFSVPLTDKLRWSNRAEIEQRVSSANPTYTASAQHIGNFSYEGKLNRTRGKVSTGLSYQFSPAFSVEVSPYLERSSFGKNRYGGTLTLSGSF